MLVLLLERLAESYSPFDLFRYITLRTILAALTALVISLAVGARAIRLLQRLRIGQQIRELGPDSHQAKAGTPTMGGALILLAVALTTLLWADLRNSYVWVLFVVTLGFGLVGFLDDWLKLRRAHSDGLSARQKLLGQLLIASVAAITLYLGADQPAQTQYLVPFVKDLLLDFGPLYLVLTVLVIVGSSNAVNLTDGLDGLAILPTVMVCAALGVFAYVTGHQVFAGYLGFPFIAEAGEVAVICGAIAGAGLGFLWFNTYPAQVFMGDVGALSLGAALGTIAVMTRQELVLFVMGGVFVAETLSVILQVASFKLTGRRIFRMSPLHHHFELQGWPEPRVIVRFWIITIILVLVGLSTLKIR